MRRRLNSIIIIASALVVVLGCTLAVSAETYVTEGDFSATTVNRINKFLNDSRWANGIEWDSKQKPKINTTAKVTGCTAYCADFVHEVYGISNVRSGCAYTDPGEVQAGDIVFTDQPQFRDNVGSEAQADDSHYHWMVVLGVNEDGDLFTAEGNAGKKVRITTGRYYLVTDEDGNTELCGSTEGRTFIAGFHFEKSPVTYTGATTIKVSSSDKYVPDGGKVTLNFGGNNNGVYTIELFRQTTAMTSSRVKPVRTIKSKTYTFTTSGDSGYYVYVTAYGKSSVRSERFRFGSYTKDHTHRWRSESKPAGYLENGYSRKRCDYCGVTKDYVKKPGYSTSYVKNFSVVKRTEGFKAKWTKQSSANQAKFTGYQVQYSTKSSMSGAKLVTVKKSASYKRIRKLKAGKKYYVRVRTYKTVNGKKYYSKWSAKKSVITK